MLLPISHFLRCEHNATAKWAKDGNPATKSKDQLQLGPVGLDRCATDRNNVARALDLRRLCAYPGEMFCSVNHLGRLLVAAFVGGVFLAACGGQQEELRVPPSEPPAREEAPDDSWDTGERASVEPAGGTSTQESKNEPKPPEFTAGMSVSDAISAVPSDYDYVGIDPDVLGKPLRNFDTYKDCKLSQADHFSVRIAVWDGKVVGADVKSPSKTKAECIEQVVRGLEYEEKELSINTVEYSY